MMIFFLNEGGKYYTCKNEERFKTPAPALRRNGGQCACEVSSGQLGSNLGVGILNGETRENTPHIHVNFFKANYKMLSSLKSQSVFNK